MKYSLCLLIFLFPMLCMATDAPATNTYPNPELLVATQWLQDNLSNESLIVVDTRTSGYAAGHIPGAVHLDCAQMHTANGLKPQQDLERLLSSAGLRKDALLVVYDNGRRSHGAAGWTFWMLEYLGCRKVRLLDGGWEKWTTEKRPAETTTPRTREGKFTAAPKAAVRADLTRTAHASQDHKEVLIDARGDAAYNGWPLDGVTRGGHIPGALNIDYAWFYAEDQTILAAAQIKSLLEGRDVTRDKRMLVYSADGSRAGLVYFVLRLMDYKHPALYDGGALQWAAQTQLPMHKLARYETLVHAQWVKDLIDGQNPPGYSGKRYVILETRYTGYSTSQPGAVEHTAEHIPGAVVVHPCYFESGKDFSKYYPKYTTPDDGNLLPDGKLQEALAALGITHDTTVVVYGSGKIIPMTSARVGWSLIYAGVADVCILNGGLTAWKAAGFPVTGTSAPWQAVPTFGQNIPVRSEYLATTAQVRAIVAGKQPTAVLVDVRKEEEYLGQKCPYPFFDKKGHIPGSIFNGDYWVLIDKNDDTWRSYTEIQDMWQKLGITPAVEPVFYCGTAWRSTVGFFHAWLMGYSHMKNYDNSFYGWSFDPANPIALKSR